MNVGEYAKATRAFEGLTAARSNPSEDEARLERLHNHVNEQTYEGLAATSVPPPAPLLLQAAGWTRLGFRPK